MESVLVLEAALLGLIEGLTEFIPVSSTGHLILAVDLLGFKGPPGRVFEIVIQFGAILAVCWIYRRRFLDTAFGIASDPQAQRFAAVLVAGVLPALAIGALAHGFIKSVLFSPWVVAVALVVGGVAILVIERMRPPERVATVDGIGLRLAFAIGLCQCVAMIPGVSRSGATIMGAMLLGTGRRAATEFSFFLAVPTMLAAASYDLYRNWSSLDGGSAAIIAVGFVTSFLAAMAVVRTVLAVIARHGFQPFAWYRIVIGLAMIALLALS